MDCRKAHSGEGDASQGARLSGLLCWFTVTAVFAGLLASQQAWTWALDRYHICLDGRTTVWVTRSWSWPLSVVSVIALLIAGRVMHNPSRRRARLGGFGLLIWALLYLLFLADDQDFMYVVCGRFLRRFRVVHWFNDAVPGHTWWHQSEYMIRVAYDPTYVLAWFLGTVQVVLGALLVVRQGFRYEDWECRECGYNLTGNLSGVCPECGGICAQRVHRDDQPSTPSDTRAEKLGMAIRVALPIVLFLAVTAALPGWTGRHRLALTDKEIAGPYELTMHGSSQKPLVFRVPAGSEAERMLRLGLGRSRDHWRLTFAGPAPDLTIAGSAMAFQVAGQKAFILVAVPGEGAVRTYERTLPDDVVGAIKHAAALLKSGRPISASTRDS